MLFCYWSRSRLLYSTPQKRLRQVVCCICNVLKLVFIWLFFYQEKKRNNLKDFLNVAGPMGVTHFLIISKSDSAPYLRVARTPQGPTITFKIHEYSLASDIAQSQLHPRCPQDLFKNSPLVYFLLTHSTLEWACAHMLVYPLLCVYAFHESLSYQCTWL